MVAAVAAAIAMPAAIVAGPVAVAAPPLPLPVVVDGQIRVATAIGGQAAVFFQTGLPVAFLPPSADGGNI